MLHAVRVRSVKLFAMTIAALVILIATSMSFATRPPVPQTRILDPPEHERVHRRRRGAGQAGRPLHF